MTDSRDLGGCQSLESIACTAATQAPGKLDETATRNVFRTYPFALAARLVNLPDNCLPDHALRWVLRLSGFATDTEDSSDR